MNRHSSAAGTAGYSPALVRQLVQFYGEELAAILTYTANSILLSPHLPAAAKLYSDIAMAEMEHFHRIGDLLRDLGASPYFSARPNVRAYHMDTNTDSHAIALTRRMLSDSIKAEETAAKEYRRMAQMYAKDPSGALFSALSDAETGHLHAFRAALRRFETS